MAPKKGGLALECNPAQQKNNIQEGFARNLKAWIFRDMSAVNLLQFLLPLFQLDVTLKFPPDGKIHRQSTNLAFFNRNGSSALPTLKVWGLKSPLAPKCPPQWATSFQPRKCLVESRGVADCHQVFFLFKWYHWCFYRRKLFSICFVK